MRQQGQALPEQLPLAEHRTQVWPPGTEPTQHGDTGPLGTGQAPPTGAELIWLLAWKSSCCCHAPLGQHRQPSLCLCMLGFVPEFQLPVQLHHDCQSRAGATTHQHPVRVSTAGSGKGAVGQNPVLWWEGFPASCSWEQLWPSQGRSATLQPAAGASGAAGSSRSGRRCWWPGPPGKH